MSIQRKRRPATTVAMAAVGGAALLAGAWFVVPGQQVDGELTSGSDPQTLADPHSDTPVGYAAMNGGTTGGFGGDNVEEYVPIRISIVRRAPGRGAVPAAQGPRRRWRRSGRPRRRHGHRRPGRRAEDRRQGRRQRVDPRGRRLGRVRRDRFKITRSENIVFRNLNIHHVSQGEGDALEVTEQSSNVWIDHNDFSSEKEGVDKDHYDGLVDIKHGSEYVTVSWNRFSDHWKTSLVGHNDSADAGPDLITYHHNHFSNLNTRVPLIRHADVHMLNNVFEDIDGSAINARMGAQVLVEGNHFDNVGSGDTDSHDGQIEGPVGWWYGSSETGYWNLVTTSSPTAPRTSTWSRPPTSRFRTTTRPRAPRTPRRTSRSSPAPGSSTPRPDPTRWWRRTFRIRSGAAPQAFAQNRRSAQAVRPPGRSAVNTSGAPKPAFGEGRTHRFGAAVHPAVVHERDHASAEPAAGDRAPSAPAASAASTAVSTSGTLTS